MDPIVILVIVVVAVAAGLAALAAVRRRRVRPTTPEFPQICVFCQRQFVGTDHVAAMKENAVRDLLGRVPASPPATDPLGNPRWFGHADCASAAGADLRTAGKIAEPPPPPPADPWELDCPACEHHFRRPDIVVSTEDWVRRYGQSAEQCPRCGHIWDTGDPPRHMLHN